MNTTWKCALVVSGKVFVALKQKMPHDAIGGHQAYFHRQKDEASNFAAGYKDHVQYMRFARDKVINTLHLWSYVTRFMSITLLKGKCTIERRCQWLRSFSQY